mmetsp:Transcript_3751/g.9744  ORF Transcript_3751/g.9744 Transcript_3751/m.9744 type:complete len:288 (+) Transcript_3751:850-1713(+)
MFVVGPRSEEAVQDVVGVCRDDQMLYRQAHALRVIPGEDVPEVSGRHAEADRAITLGAQPEERVEIVRDLEHDPGPVDGIDGAEPILLLEVEVAEKSLHDILAVIESALDCDAMDVFVEHARHLLLLNCGNTALGKQDEALHVLLATQAINRSTPRVTAGRSEHREPPGPPLQEVFVQIAESLEGDVLERERRAMEELHYLEVAHLDTGHDVWMREGRITATHDVAELLRRNLLLAAIQRSDLEGQLVETQQGPGVDFRGGIGNFIRDEEPSVRREPLEHRLFEGQT